MKIFVSIASYMDHQLEETIDSCLENAHFKDRINIAVCDQSMEFNQTVHDKVKYYTFIDYRSARGPCWARHLLQTVMQDEEYYLQVDSHTLFHEDWDVHLAHHIDKLGKNAIISTYPLDHKDDFEKMNEWTWCLRVDPTKLFDRYTYFNTQIGHSKTKTIHKGFLLAGGFLFSHRSFVEQVPYDPVFYFAGEEPSLALRAFTHNFDIYHVPDVPLRHNYINNGTRPLQWERDDEWHRLQLISEERFSDLINDKLRGPYGLGYQRSISDYRRFCGIDYPNRAIVSDIAFGDSDPGTS